MYPGFMHCLGNYLHGFSTCSIPSHIFQVTPAAHHHSMPVKQHFFREWFSKRPVEINHHLSDSSLCWPNPSLVRSQSQLLADRGLHANPIQNFTFDFRSRDRFRAHRLDGELIALLISEMAYSADEHSSANQELLLCSLQACSVPLKGRPVRLLPVPRHER